MCVTSEPAAWGVVVVTDVMGDGGVPTRGERRARGEQAAAVADRLPVRRTHTRTVVGFVDGGGEQPQEEPGIDSSDEKSAVMNNRDYP